jgi:hypothetical protein
MPKVAVPLVVVIAQAVVGDLHPAFLLAVQKVVTLA